MSSRFAKLSPQQMRVFEGLRDGWSLGTHFGKGVARSYRELSGAGVVASLSQVPSIASSQRASLRTS